MHTGLPIKVVFIKKFIHYYSTKFISICNILIKWSKGNTCIEYNTYNESLENRLTNQQESLLSLISSFIWNHTLHGISKIWYECIISKFGMAFLIRFLMNVQGKFIFYEISFSFLQKISWVVCFAFRVWNKKWLASISQKRWMWVPLRIILSNFFTTHNLHMNYVKWSEGNKIWLH